MTEIADFLFSQFKDYTPLFLALELTAVFFGLLSVIFSARNSILVYPTGMVSTAIFIYIVSTAHLYGDLIINFFYFIMSLYGWIIWKTKKSGDADYLKITRANAKDNLKSLLLFVISVIFVSAVYIWFNMFHHWWAYVDTFITGLFFVGMWQLAQRKIDNWRYLILGDVIGIPLFFYKGLIFTGFFYILLTIIAVFGYIAWKRILLSEEQTQ